MKKNIFLLIIFVFSFFFSTNFVFAQTATPVTPPATPASAPASETLLESINKQNNAFEKGSSVGAPKDIRLIVANIIKVFLGFVGLLATVYLVYGGYMYMTSSGNESRAGDASKIMLYSALGLFIVLASYSITNFVYKTFEKSLEEQTIKTPEDTKPIYLP